MPLLNACKNIYQRFGSEPTYWIAYSGGLDSHVLLHLMVSLRALTGMRLRAVHINHSLSVNAIKWSQHCQQICQQLDVDFTTVTIDARAGANLSPEAVARELRYQQFKKLLVPGDILLVAQHQNDQAETVMLQLLRGAGPKGLAGMPQIKKLGQGFLARPLLDFSRKELENYAQQQQLSWIEDESNQNVKFTRNFLRHQVIPLLQQRWPNVSSTLKRVGDNCAEAQTLLQEYAAQDYATAKAATAGTLSVTKLTALSEARQRLVLRTWLEEHGVPLPSAKKLSHIQSDLVECAADRNPEIKWDKYTLRRYKDSIYILCNKTLNPVHPLQVWDFLNSIEVAGGVLSAELVVGQGLRADLPAVTVRSRQGGEVCHLAGRHCHHQLKKLLQVWRVPPWERDKLALIFSGTTLVAIPGYFMDENYTAVAGERGYLLKLSKK